MIYFLVFFVVYVFFFDNQSVINLIDFDFIVGTVLAIVEV